MKTQIIINIDTVYKPKYKHNAEVIISHENSGIEKYYVSTNKRQLNTIVESLIYECIHFEEIKTLRKEIGL